MRSTGVIALGAVGAVAAVVALATQEHEVVADCVRAVQQPDGSYAVVDDQFCEGGSHHGYVYVYGGNSSGGYVRGATSVRPADTTIVTRSGKTITRSGFGGRGSGGS
ncbi:hypothetical protein ACIBKY_51140 [Nonomuraea sp. NPDC050394]|uniref:hypothetical protein n=1 Tax=Nonomuraea sp. NPDC050394 TaxID=3364363 RepID=UPI00379CE4CD